MPWSRAARRRSCWGKKLPAVVIDAACPARAAAGSTGCAADLQKCSDAGLRRGVVSRQIFYAAAAPRQSIAPGLRTEIEGDHVGAGDSGDALMDFARRAAIVSAQTSARLARRARPQLRLPDGVAGRRRMQGLLALCTHPPEIVRTEHGAGSARRPERLE